jgi:hypothetical protein
LEPEASDACDEPVEPEGVDGFDELESDDPAGFDVLDPDDPAGFDVPVSDMSVSSYAFDEPDNPDESDELMESPGLNGSTGFSDCELVAPQPAIASI